MHFRKKYESIGGLLTKLFLRLGNESKNYGAVDAKVSFVDFKSITDEKIVIWWGHIQESLNKYFSRSACKPCNVLAHNFLNNL